MFNKIYQVGCCKLYYQRIVKYSTIYDQNKQILSDIFGLSENQVYRLLAREKRLAKRETDEIRKSYQFCKQIGFTNEDILNFPGLLVHGHLFLYQGFMALEETGCRPVKPELLAKSQTFKLKRILEFKTHQFLAADINVVDEFLKYLNPPIEKPEAANKNIDELDTFKWTDIHRIIQVEWLKARLNATDDDITKLFRIHKMIKNKSFRVVNENISLAESLGLSHEKILKCGFLLNNYPEYPKTVLQEFPDLAGIDMRKAMKVNPKLMMIAPKKILMVYGILKEFGIPDEFIRGKPQIFTMNPDTVRFRLEEMRRVPEFRLLFSHPRICHLVVHHNKVKSNLSFVQKLQLKCAGFGVLGYLRDELMENHIKQGKDAYPKRDVVQYFQSLLKRSASDVSKKLVVHPYYCYVPFNDIEDTFNYLINCGYTKEHMYKGLLVLLYPKDKIECAISNLKQDTDLNFYQLSKSKQLQIILYQIEKDHHFTGNGIWNTKFRPQESEEKI